MTVKTIKIGNITFVIDSNEDVSIHRQEEISNGAYVATIVNERVNLPLEDLMSFIHKLNE